MRAPRRVACVATALLAVAVAAGCTGTGGGSSTAKISGDTLTIYSSQSLTGPLADRGRDIVDAERLALEQANGRVGKFRIRFRSLNDVKPLEPDATPEERAEARTRARWDPGQVSANARTATQDDTTIAYIGEMDTGASAISIPILNQAHILQVSPSDTPIGLTRRGPSNTNEPDKYYPTDERTFGRVIPADHVQAQALLSWMRDEGVRRLFILNDDDLYGRGLADRVERTARRAGIEVVANKEIRPNQQDFRGLAQEAAGSGAQAVLFAGTPQDRADLLFRQLNRADPNLKLFGPSALARPAFVSALDSAAARATYLTDPVVPRPEPPRAAAFVRAFRERTGRVPDRYAIYGYEAMNAVLAAIRAAGNDGNDRERVVDEFLQLRRSASALGPYRIDRRGDTSIERYGGYRVRDGRLVFDRVLVG